MSPHDADAAAQSGHIGELLAWTRVNSLDSLRRELERELVKRQDYLIYENTDGSRNQAMVAKEAGVSQPTVSRKWSMWRDLGLIYEEPGEDNPTHLLPPTALGLETPDG